MKKLQWLLLFLTLQPATQIFASCSGITERLITTNGEADPCNIPTCSGLLTLTQDLVITTAGDLNNDFMGTTADLSGGTISGGCVEILAQGTVDTTSLPTNLTTTPSTAVTGIVINGSLELTGQLTMETSSTLTINGNLTLLDSNFNNTNMAIIVVNGNATIIATGTFTNHGLFQINGNNTIRISNSKTFYNGMSGTISATDTGAKILIDNHTGIADNDFLVYEYAIINNGTISADTEIQFYNNQHGDGTSAAINNTGTITATDIIICDNNSGHPMALTGTMPSGSITTPTCAAPPAI